MAVGYSSERASFGKPRVWIEKAGGAVWDISPDGKRLLVLAPVATNKTDMNEHEIALDSILLIRPGSIPKTTSGKIQRNLARRMWLQNSFKAVDMLST